MSGPLRIISQMWVTNKRKTTTVVMRIECWVTHVRSADQKRQQAFGDNADLKTTYQT